MTATTAAAEQYVRTALGVPDDLDDMMRWDDLMDDLYRAAGKSWEVDQVDHDVFWAIVWANRRSADNTDRANMVSVVMHAARDMGADEDMVRDMVRDQWERRRAESDHVTVAREYPMGRADAYDDALAVACNGDSDAHWAAALRNGAPCHAGPRARWEVLVIA